MTTTVPAPPTGGVPASQWPRWAVDVADETLTYESDGTRIGAFFDDGDGCADFLAAMHGGQLSAHDWATLFFALAAHRLGEHDATGLFLLGMQATHLAGGS